MCSFNFTKQYWTIRQHQKKVLPIISTTLVNGEFRNRHIKTWGSTKNLVKVDSVCFSRASFVLDKCGISVFSRTMADKLIRHISIVGSVSISMDLFHNSYRISVSQGWPFILIYSYFYILIYLTNQSVWFYEHLLWDSYSLNIHSKSSINLHHNIFLCVSNNCFRTIEIQ